MTPRRRPASALAHAAAGGVGVLALAGGLAAAVGAWSLAAVRRAERAAGTGVYDPGGVLAGRNGRRPRADALVVLGARASSDGPSVELRARLDHAAALWRSGVAPRMLVSGGEACGVDEPAVMASYLEAVGLPREAVAPVRPSENTRTLLRTLAEESGARYVAVSSPYHALRLAKEARRRGVRLAVAAPPRTPETARPRVHRVRLASEVVAVVWYALPVCLTGRVDTGPGSLRHAVPAVLTGRDRPTTLLRALRRRPW